MSRAVENNVGIDHVLARDCREDATRLLCVEPNVVYQVPFNTIEPGLISSPAINLLPSSVIWVIGARARQRKCLFPLLLDLLARSPEFKLDVFSNLRTRQHHCGSLLPADPERKETLMRCCCGPRYGNSRPLHRTHQGLPRGSWGWNAGEIASAPYPFCRAAHPNPDLTQPPHLVCLQKSFGIARACQHKHEQQRRVLLLDGTRVGGREGGDAIRPCATVGPALPPPPYQSPCFNATQAGW